MQHLMVTFTIFTIFTDLSKSETTADPPVIDAIPTNMVITAPQNTEIDKNVLSPQMWIYNPMEHAASVHEDINQVKNRRGDPMMPRPPHSITKLAKSLSYGFDPYFSKRSFEPFETRPKPITLVAFRKNGIVPRENTKLPNIASAEIAELQSPFNVISNFWSDFDYFN